MTNVVILLLSIYKKHGKYIIICSMTYPYLLGFFDAQQDQRSTDILHTEPQVQAS
jgi:hypothetical protein